MSTPPCPPQIELRAACAARTPRVCTSNLLTPRGSCGEAGVDEEAK
jgi:hypothetical protein